MFEPLRLLGTLRTSIVVQTRRGRPIENEQELDPALDRRRKWDLLRKRHPGWIQRSEPCGVYNCAGHVWASRRTSVFEETEWQKIFADDEYRVIDEASSRQGDLAVYRTDDQYGYLHVGVIVELRRIASESQGLPWVLSKFDSMAGEVLHSLRDVPYTFQYVVEVWTDRKVMAA